MKKINLTENLSIKKLNPNIRTYVGPSRGLEGFYKKFGFISREEAELGKGMILKI